MCSLTYPVAATLSKTNVFFASPTLDGLAWHQSSHPEEWEAISWLNGNVDGAPVIVTAPGWAYTDHGIISECTGLPTILGWEGHEWVWRGSDRDYRGRREDIDQIYQGEDLDQVEALLEKYDVTFVYIGRLEREMYGADVGEKFADFMDVAFENEGVIIYRIKE